MKFIPSRHRWLPAAFAAACVAGIAAEIYLVFVDRDGSFRIEGRQIYDVTEFGAGGLVAHGFLMRGEGMHSVSVQVRSDREASATVQWSLWRGFADKPKEMTLASGGTETFALRRGPQWKTISFTRDGTSRDRWYTLQLRLVQATPIANSDGTPPAGPPQLSIVASRDNPERGGVLFVNDVRQTGSLVLRAERRGRTIHRRFVEDAVPRLPAPLQNGTLLWTIAVVLHWALVVFAYAVVKEGSSPSALRVSHEQR